LQHSAAFPQHFAAVKVAPDARAHEALKNANVYNELLE
jgi:hypothetical protein